MARNPELSVVMPVRNEEAHLGTLLHELLGQTLAPDCYEILVVDGRSTDGTREVVRAIMADHPQVRLLDNAKGLASCARNVGALAADGKFVLFVDGHCHIPFVGMLESALLAFRRGEACLSRPQPLVPERKGAFSEAVAVARNSPLGHNVGSKIYSNEDRHCDPLSAGCGYARDLFLELGGLDESFDAAEDLEFNYRVRNRGVRAFHSEDFSVEYQPRGNPLALFRQLYRYGYGRARLTRKHPVAFSPLSTLLGLLGAWFILAPVLVAIVPQLLPLFQASLGAYALITGLTAAWAARWRSPLFWLKTWSAFPMIHFGAGLGYLVGLMKGPDWRHAPSL